MKLLIAALCTGLAMLAGSGTALAQTRILFVGNSFTHGYVAPVLNYNAAAIFDENYGVPANSPRHESDDTGPWGGVPGIFKRFTDEAGLAYEVHIEAINGVGLSYHYTNALSVIGRAAGWDKVVLQELSTGPLPTNKGGNPTDFFTYATQLEQAVHSANAAAKVYLYETWARADLTYPAGQPYSGQPISAMGTDLHNAYNQLFAQNGHFEAVAPVGDAWQLAMQTGVAMPNPYNPTAGQLDLWTSYFHASKWGSYLSACVLFGQITGADPRSLGSGETAAADLGIAPADAVALQQVAYNQLSAMTSPSTYSLSVATTGSGTVTKNPDQATYAIGSNVTLTATPAAGFTFTGWSGDATGSTNPLTVAMTANKSITATFTAVAPTTYTLTAATTGGGTVTKTPNQASYASGSSIMLTAAAATGYTFTGWSGDATGSTNPLTVTMTANKTVTATFTAAGQSVVSYVLVDADTDTDIQVILAGATLNLAALSTRNLNIRATTNPATVGSVVFALSGTQTRSQTESVAPYALFGDDGAGKFNSWTPAVGNYTLTATPYTAGSGSGTAGTPLSISFSVSNQAAPANYSLTVSTAGSGTVTKNPDQATYASGASVSLTATPAAGYQFSGWSGDTTGSTNPLTVTMTANKAITATFTATTTSGTDLTFYRALNINGNALVLDGQNWEAATGAANFTVTGTEFTNQNVSLNPATDALRAGMIRSSVYGPSIDATLRNVPAGTYAVYAYVWEDNSPETFDVRVQGQVVLASYNSGTAGHWSRLGPYPATVTDNGNLVLSTSGGYANLSGVEVWRQNADAARTILNSDFNSSTQPAPSAGLSSRPDEVRATGPTSSAIPLAYPNPTGDGRLWVLLPSDFEGPVAYSLVSVLGAKLASGQLTEATQPLNFSRELITSGLYYLLLEGRKQRAQIKLIRP
ncbi:InlB B-repeat-containing protein [Hymenobacter negativus]|uniref:InlB B-repeat-containing protein n=1 Tax=Hymenobacter negativus TaxID=2795026 RepID=A0ABS0QB35_9BACT|nr:InlB B-repeat-containing protein [Hymenobacter negativus]MBH8559912.1 InlB B-repeat-containing protein [Hymenobacter negativus]